MLTVGIGEGPGELRVLFRILNILAGHLTTKGSFELA